MDNTSMGRHGASAGADRPDESPAFAQAETDEAGMGESRGAERTGPRGHRRGLETRLGLGVTLPVLLALLIAGLAGFTATQSEVDALASEGARRSLVMAMTAVRTAQGNAAEGYLRARAEEAVRIISIYDDHSRKGPFEKSKAWASVGAILLDHGAAPELSGDLAIVDAGGKVILHSGYPQSNHDSDAFLQKAHSLNEGFIAYQSRSDEGMRDRLAYVIPYAPRDLFVLASIDAKEATGLVDAKAMNGGLGDFGLVDTLDRVWMPDAFVTDTDGSLVFGRDRFGLSKVLATRSKYATVEGERIRIDRSPVPDSRWTLVVATPLHRYERLPQTIALVVLAALLLVALAVRLSVRFLLARYLRPIAAMRKVVERISSGDLTGRLPADSDDELSDIADLFNRVLDEFAAVLERMKGVIALLGESIQNLASSTQQIASTSNEQAASVKEILSTMEDADRLSKGVETRVNEVAKIAIHTKENVEKGFALIQTSLGKMKDISSTNDDTLAGIKTLGDLIESIWDIVTIISGFADQTRIIAFNAELEAAAAGDAGRNFQIVAGEIRRLADSTVGSTDEIKSKINEIQHASDRLILASEGGTKRIREGSEVSSEIRGVFEDVLMSSEISANSASDISRSINMQVISFEQIVLTLKQISESIDSFVQSTSYTTEVSDKLKAIADSFRSQLAVYALRDSRFSSEGGR